MASKKGIPDFDIDLLKKKKKKDKRLSTVDASMVRKARLAAKQREMAKHRKEPEIREPKAVEKLSKKLSTVSKTVSQPNTLPMVTEGPAGSTTRFKQMVKRVTKLEDVQKLKRIIYNRNYRLRQKFKREHPEVYAQNLVREFPPQEDIRIVGPATLKRLSKIKDTDKLIEELKKLVINTTRRRNVPKTTGDFSNKERDYLENGINALKDALSSWQDDMLQNKLEGVFEKMTVMDIQNIFETAPSYWAISSGYYYAIEKFDNFMEEIFSIINKHGVQLTGREKQELKERLFSNDPRTHDVQK